MPVKMSRLVKLLPAQLPVQLCAFVMATLLTGDLNAAEPNSVPRIQYELAGLQSPHGPVQMIGSDARWQLQVTSIDSDGNTVDVTREVQYNLNSPIVSVGTDGYLRPLKNGQAQITAKWSTDAENGAELTAQIDVQVTGMDQLHPVNFRNQIIPIFTKFGCNGGGCHGKAAGQAGFKLSLLGFEPQEDFDHLINESRGRRLFPSFPSQSLLLQKAINAAPHGGGKRMDQDSHEYRLLERWIATGTPYGSNDDPVVEKIQVVPADIRRAPEGTQQLRVTAHYSDGHIEDITRTAQYESNNTDMAEVDELGFVKLGTESGDVSVMARYQGKVAVFRSSIPLGIDIESWPPERNVVDTFVFAKLKNLGIPASQLSDDSTFIRRVTLDLAGRLPTIQETEQFLSEADESKYDHLVDRLLESTDYAEYFAKKWSAILRNRRDKAGDQFGSYAFYDWLRSSLHSNVSYADIVRQLLTASGSVDSNPAVVWLREVPNTESRVEDAAQLFLGQRLQCARCHHHPFEKWSQADYFKMAAFFSKIQRKEGEHPDEPVYISRLGGAAARHPKTGQNLKPAGLDGPELALESYQDPRSELVEWMVAPENPFFARSLVNRYWKHFFASGMVEPEDDMRVTNPPSNPELLDALADHFVSHDFDLKSLIRLICTSSAYRLASHANDHNLSDRNSYSRFYPKRLSSEVLLDAVNQVTMTSTNFDGMPDQTRAVRLPDTNFSSYFLDVFGKPDSTTACECERSGEATLAQSLHLLNSKEVQEKLKSDSGRAAALAQSSDPLDERVTELYLAALSRAPTPAELDAATGYLNDKAADQRAAFEDLVWAMINSKEFLFNH